MKDNKKIEKLNQQLIKKFQSKNYQKAFRLADKLLKINPKDMIALKIKALCCYQLEKHDLGIETAQKLLKINPEDYGVYEILGDFFAELRLSHNSKFKISI